MFVLLHSPLVGPSTWHPVAEELRRAGRRAVVPSLGVAAAAPPYWPAAVDAAGAAAGRVGAGAGETDVVVVAHSNAGLLTPAVVARLGELGHTVRACVLVDAALPGRAGAVALAAPDLLALLERKAEGGLLPRWTEWWDPATVAELLPEEGLRRRIIEDQPRLPLDYFRQEVPVPAGWDQRQCAYLWFGPPYDREAARAGALGWPVRRLPGGHLHALVDPVGVAGAVLELSA